MLNIKIFLANLPREPGVYQMLGENQEVLYIGKAKSLKQRISSYFSGKIKDLKTLTLLNHVKDIDITVTHTPNEAVLLECNLIKKHKPRYNVLLRDDKSYPYILITEHSYPRITFYRGPRKKQGFYFGPYPNSSAVRQVINLLQKIFRLRSCTDNFFNARTRPCLLYQIKRCSGPCVSYITETQYAKDIQLAILFLQGKSKEVLSILKSEMMTASAQLDFEIAARYRDHINRLKEIQEPQYINAASGNADIVGFAKIAGVICIQLLTLRNGQILGSRSYYPKTPPNVASEEVITAFLTQHYLGDITHQESIPSLIVVPMNIIDVELMQNTFAHLNKMAVKISHPLRGEKKKWLNIAMNSAKQALSAHLFNKTNLKERLHILKEILTLKGLPKRIECFDVSHMMGEATVASCVVFDEEGPRKADYRRFNINHIAPGDDLAAMRQAILRRYKRLILESAVLPDLLLIDGGKIQLAAVHTILSELQIKTIKVVGIAKGPTRKPGFEVLHQLDSPPLHLSADNHALHFIQQIRDEAHRFALMGHRQKRDKIRKRSVLENIPGIGAKRRRELLRYFGGIQGVAHASLDELANVPGISRSLAEKIFTVLHESSA